MVNAVDGLLNNVGGDLNGVWNNVLQKIKSVFYNTDTKIFSNSSYPEYYRYKKTNKDGTQTYLIYNGELKNYTTYQITEEGEIDSRQTNSIHIPDEKTMIALLYDKIKYSSLPKVIIDREKQEPKILGNLAFGKSIKKGVSKVASKVKTGAKQYAASTPQGQAITAGQSAMKKQKSKGTKSVISKLGKKGGKVSGWFSNLTETKIYGIPVLYAGLGTMFIGLPLLKRMGRRR